MATLEELKRKRTTIVESLQTVNGSNPTVFTCPQGYKAVVTMFFLANKATGAHTISAQIYHVADLTTHTFLSAKNMAAGEYVEFGGPYGHFVALDSGDQFRLLLDADAKTTTIISYEIYRADGL